MEKKVKKGDVNLIKQLIGGDAVSTKDMYPRYDLDKIRLIIEPVAKQ